MPLGEKIAQFLRGISKNGHLAGRKGVRMINVMITLTI
jgi:hypothetical protein